MKFDQPAQSSDGGAILLSSLDRRMGLSHRMAQAVMENRQSGKIEHSLLQLFRQRIYSIACGYPDCNDSALLANDPVLKLCCGRPPRDEGQLASQPTQSRFENSVSRTDVLRIAFAMADVVLAAHQRRRRANPVKLITIDLDGTIDRTYGSQQLTFFHGFYDSYGYLPLIPTIQFDGESDEHLLPAMLRPGNSSGARGAIAYLIRLLPRLRRAFPSALLRFRADSAFAIPALLEFLEAEGVEYFIGFSINSRLEKLALKSLRRVHIHARQSGRSQRQYQEISYRARSWNHIRRIVLKSEVVVSPQGRLRDNPRFVITNSKITSARVYSLYHYRGDMENRLKELKDGLSIDRTSCSRFIANQFRVLLTSAAFFLFQSLRWLSRGTELARAQVSTLQNRIIKLGVTVCESARRVVLSAPKTSPWARSWRSLALACGALDG
ncbi:MAG: IS1380 family transposase [Planctomycetes bacterium]|nr:IS1380 family transposase [Planctomycetota bacterium]